MIAVIIQRLLNENLPRGPSAARGQPTPNQASPRAIISTIPASSEQQTRVVTLSCLDHASAMPQQQKLASTMSQPRADHVSTTSKPRLDPRLNHV